jgi:integrase/recombinase XerD
MGKENEIVAVEKEPDLMIVAQNMKGISENTKKTYANAAKSYIDFLKFKNVSMGLDSMQEWIYSFDSPKTQNTYLQALKKILREVYEDHPKIMELEKIFKKLKSIKVDGTIKEQDFLTFKEFKCLVKNSPEKYALIIEAFFWTGCRVSELLSIKLKDCAKTSDHYTITIVGKGSKQRDVFISTTLFNRVKSFFNGSTYLFEHKGKMYNRSFVSNEIKKLSKQILDRKISAHNLRHSKAMHLKDVMKLSPDQVQKALGHADVSTTLTHYYHGTPTAKDQGIGE